MKFYDEEKFGKWFRRYECRDLAYLPGVAEIAERAATCAVTSEDVERLLNIVRVALSYTEGEDRLYYDNLRHNMYYAAGGLP